MLDGCLPRDRKRAFGGLGRWLRARPGRASLAPIEVLESSVRQPAPALIGSSRSEMVQAEWNFERTLWRP